MKTRNKMKKLAFTIGDFDCINQDHLHLIKEMRKIVMPDNKVVAVLTDDYGSFVVNGVFPIQDMKRRQDNLSYFVKDIAWCFAGDYKTSFIGIINKCKAEGLMPIFVAYDDNKNFKDRDILKKNGVSIRFIKKSYGKA